MIDNPAPERVLLDNFPVDRISLSGTVFAVEQSLSTGRQLKIATANMDFLALARRDSTFLQLLHRFELIVADGVPLLWLAKLAGQPLAGRVNGTDLVVALVEVSARRSWTIVLVGSLPEVAARAARELTRRFPGAHVVPIPTPILRDETDRLSVARAAAAAKPDIVLVGLGAPRQEQWVNDYLGVTGARVGIGVGGSFDILSGSKPRAPRWMQRIGLEWAWRAAQDPKRLVRRYVADDGPAAVATVTTLVARRAGRVWRRIAAR